MRGLIHHSRRDPRNARGVEPKRSGPSLHVRRKSGAATAGVHALGAGRLLTFFVIPSAVLQTQKKTRQKDGCSRTAPYLCAATREHPGTLAQPHALTH